MGFSKSRYTTYYQCPKRLWMDMYKPELAEKGSSDESMFEEGHEVGGLAQKWFGDFVDATVQDAGGSLDYAAMLKRTQQCIREGVENICEAAFSYKGNYCAVDLLHKVDGGYEIYEVKSSVDVKEVNLVDVAYQKYVVEHCGLTVVNAYVLHVNRNYVQRGNVLSAEDIFLKEFLVPLDVKEEILPFYNEVERNLTRIEMCIGQKVEPNMPIGGHCSKPYDCPYAKYCWRNVPVPSVFDLTRMNVEEACQHYYNGVASYQELLDAGVKLSEKQQMQIDYYLHDKGTFMDKDRVKAFLNTLSFPLYFLDFEAFTTKIPKYDGQTPTQQIPFQYSLHILYGLGEGQLEHREFLAQEDTDPRYEIAKSLVENIPDNVCVLAYHKSFECGRLEELAERFTEFRTHLLKIKDNIKDLKTVFSQWFVYNRAMGKSFSIKSVLPAIFPDDPTLDYHNLDSVHNGTEAADVFLNLPTVNPEEKVRIREGLLKYCELDTYAMVKLYQWLVEHSK